MSPVEKCIKISQRLQYKWLPAVSVRTKWNIKSNLIERIFPFLTTFDFILYHLWDFSLWVRLDFNRHYFGAIYRSLLLYIIYGIWYTHKKKYNIHERVIILYDRKDAILNSKDHDRTISVK